MDEQGCGWSSKALVAAMIDTVLGAAIDVASMSSSIAKISGVDPANSFKSFKPVYLAALTPMMFRNYQEWALSCVEFGGEGDEKKSMLQRLGLRSLAGIVAGAVTTIPDTMINRVMIEAAKQCAITPDASAFSNALKASSAVMREIIAKPQDFFVTCARSAPARILPCAVGTLIFSKEGDEIAKLTMKEIADAFSRGSRATQQSLLSHLWHEFSPSSEKEPLPAPPSGMRVAQSLALPPSVLPTTSPQVAEGFGSRFLQNLAKQFDPSGGALL